VLFADEAFWAGNKEGEGLLKTLITEGELAYEAKGIDAVWGANYVHLFISSNKEWVIPTEVDDRRFFVLDVSANRQGDRPYFQAIVDQMSNGGRAAMLYDLQHMDLSNFEVRDVPKTAALADQKQLSLVADDQWLYDKLHEGRWFRWHNGWEDRVPADLIHDDYIHKTGRTGEKYKSTSTRLGMHLKKVLGNLPKKLNQYYEVPTDQVYTKGKLKGTPIFKAQYGSEYCFPTLKECRKAFDRYLRTEIKWPKEEDPPF